MFIMTEEIDYYFFIEFEFVLVGIVGKRLMFHAYDLLQISTCIKGKQRLSL